jgi:choline dehydrogenase
MREAAASDYVIVGGGSAGCVLASRLTEDAGTRVTLLEAGPWDRDRWIHIPMGFARLAVTRRFDWNYTTEPEAELDGRRMYWPRGKVIGGSGSVNGLVFLRGSPRDYDRWAQAGARGWSYEECLPAFRKLEKWAGPPNEYHGTDGPMCVGETRHISQGSRAFVAACQELGYERNHDVNGAWYEGVAPNPLNVHEGRRCSPAVGYLKPALGRPNLAVETGVLGLRVRFDGKRAVGVEVSRDSETIYFPARREVILSSGAIESPKLLMLSGVGDAEALAAHGIPVIHHSPGIGGNLQDHLLVRFFFRTHPIGTLNERLGTWWRKAATGAHYFATRSGPMTVGASEASLFARVLPGAEEPDTQFNFVNFSFISVEKGLHPHPGVTLNYCQARPDSRGTLTLASADAAAKPVLRPNYLSDPTDTRLVLEAAKVVRRIADTKAFRAIAIEEIQPGPATADDADLHAYIRANAATCYHPCGTAQMGGEHAPLDPELRVRGVHGLRVADASAFPLMPTSNIHPAVLMLAERAAEKIRASAASG